MGKLKQVSAIVGGVIILALMSGVIILNSIEFNQYKSQISEQVKVLTGRELVIAGDLDLQISLSPKVSVDGVTFANAEWGSNKKMVSVKRLIIQVKLIPILFGDIEITQLILEEPEVLLETDAKGIGNWIFKPEEKTTEEKKEGTAALPVVNNVRIDKARFTYIDGRTSKKSTVVIDTLEASAVTLESPLSILFKGSYDNKQLEITGTINNIAALMSGRSINLNLKAKANEAIATLTGSGSVSESGNLYRLDDFDLQMNKHRVHGKLSMDLRQKRPLLNVEINSDLIDLRESPEENVTEAEIKKEDKKKTKLFSAQPLPVDGMRALDAEIAFSSNKILGTRFALNNVIGHITLKQGILKITPLTMTIGDGQLSSSIFLDGSKLPVSLKLAVSGKSLDLGKMLIETGVTDLVTGALTQVDIELKGRGKSVSSIIGSLNGKALLNIGKGRINNKYMNLAGADLINQLVTALNPVSKKEAFTNLECAVVNMRLKNGVAKYDKRIAVETDKMTVVSSGEINLAKETLDIGFKPMPRKDTIDLGIHSGDLVSAVRLHGSLAKPELGLDTAGTAKAGLKIYTAIATGGTSLLLGGLLDKAMADPHPCLTALGKSAGAGTSSKQNSEKTEPVKKESGGGFFDSLKKRLGG